MQAGADLLIEKPCPLLSAIMNEIMNIAYTQQVPRMPQLVKEQAEYGAIGKKVFRLKISSTCV